MKVHYNKGMGCPVEISDGKTATCISLDAAKELQANLSAIIEQAENTPEEEMSEMEIRLLSWLSDDTSGEIPMERMKHIVKARAAELLALAREQFIKDGYVIEKKAFHDAFENISDKHRAEMSVEYSIHCKVEDGTRHAIMNWEAFQKVAQKFIEIGKAEALKDLPRWEKWRYGACGNGRGIPIAIVKRGLNGYELVDSLGVPGEKYIMLSDLEKLPGFKEDESHE